MQTDSKGSIVKTEPGSKPILDPKKASLKDLRDRAWFLDQELRKRIVSRTELNRQIIIIDAERNGLTDAALAATAKLLANGGRA